MSSALAIQAVTTALKNRLGPAVANNVRLDPPDLASTETGTPFLNLFLYEVLPNTAWRNQEYPSRGGSSTLRPPLALDLRYLLTPHQRDSTGADTHRLLGEAMLLLHDGALLSRGELAASVVGTGVENQLDQVKVTQLHLPLEDLAKLWTAFGTGYRLSVAYQVTVVLIDTTAPAPAPLPVLQRGSRDPLADEAPYVAASAGPWIAGLLVEAWGNESFPARQGDRIVIEGRGFAGDDLRVRFAHPALGPDPLEVTPDEIGSERIVAKLPDALPLGFSTVAVAAIQPGGGAITTNRLALGKAARVALTKELWTGRSVEVTARLIPAPRDGAQIVILIGDSQRVATEELNGQFSATAVVPDSVGAGTRLAVRVRVDGVDSIPLPDPVAGAPFSLDWAPGQTVSVP